MSPVISVGPTRRRLRELRRRLLLHRRLLAALCAAAAVVLGLHAARPAAAVDVGVWTAARDLPGGAVLSAADLRRTPYPPAAVPAHAATAASLVGRTLAAPVRDGVPLTDLSVVGRPLAAHYPGRTVVPARLGDPAAAALVRPGDRVDVVAGDPSGNGAGHVVSVDAVVVAVPRSEQTDTTTSADAPPGRLVLLAVDAADATAVSAAGLTGFLTLTWVH